MQRLPLPRRIVGVALAVVAFCVALGDVQGAWALRYASPAGKSTNNCRSPATACDLRTAVEGKPGNEPITGEEVIIEPGSYSVSSTIKTGAPELNVHGMAGQPRPILAGKEPEILRDESDSTFGYLDIEEQGSGEALFSSGGTLERLLIRGRPEGNELCQCYSGTLRDSVLVSLPGASSGAVGTHSNGGTTTEVLRNDTIYSESAQAPAIELEQVAASGELVVNAYNTIAVNAAGGHDLSATKHGTIMMTHSDFASPTGAGTITSGPGDVNAPPQFVNAAASNFHELAGSPTVDKGLNEAEDGTLDFEGDPREFGSSTDIGAYEYSPPPTCKPLTATTPFGQQVTIELSCSEPAGAPLTYAIVGAPAHGTLSLTAATGHVLYTPAQGYSGPDSFSYDATSSNGTAVATTVSITVGAAPPAVTPAASATPILTDLSETVKTWREGHALAHITARKKKPTVGTSFSFRLNESASVTLTFTTFGRGRRVGKRCVAQTEKDRSKRRCSRTVTAGTLTFSAHVGTNTVRFDGLISAHKKLAPGGYTLMVAATASGKRSATRTLHFTIVQG